MTTYQCLICGGAVTPTVRQGHYTYRECPACATVQLLPQPSVAELDEYYRTYHLSDEAGGVYDAADARMQADFPHKAALARACAPGPGARLLDVGCGKGYFQVEANRVGFDSVGIDLSESGVAFARDRAGVNARVGRIESDAPPEWAGAFDVATFWATIEHLPDPLATLTAIARCLKPGGTLLLDTGYSGAAAERWLVGYSQWHIAPEHLWVFGRRGLQTLLERAGLHIDSCDTNAERSTARRAVRWVRHTGICLLSYLALRLPLGRAGFRACRAETKWPIGRLISIRARKP